MLESIKNFSRKGKIELLFTYGDKIAFGTENLISGTEIFAGEIEDSENHAVICVKLDKSQSSRIFAKKLEQNINRLAYSMEGQQAEVILELFDYIEKMDLEIDIAEAQNTYYNRIYHRIGEIIEVGKKSKRKSEKLFAQMLLDIGEKLNINTDFYKTILEREL